MIRAAVIAAIEYILAVVVLWKGKLYPKICAALLFFLAGYQLGELVLFVTNGAPAGIRIAYFSTTLLPPLGLLLVEKISGKKLGFPYFMAAGLFFAVCYALFPYIAGTVELTSCCVRMSNRVTVLPTLWSYYYIGTLIYTMLLMLFFAFQSKAKWISKTLLILFMAYASFFFVSTAVIFIWPERRPSYASLMCALAVGAAITIAALSLTSKYPKRK